MEPEKETYGLDIEKIRGGIPMLGRHVHGKPLVYLDSAASTHKPQVVIDRIRDFYTKEYAKPDEEHYFSKQSTELKEAARKKMARFLKASSEKEIVFTKGCTEGVNIVANGLAQAGLEAGDEIIVSQLEHHANIVPWLMAGQLTGAVVKVAPITARGELDLDALEGLINERTRVISVAHSSHVLGTIFPIKEIAALAHRRDIALVVDGAQAAPHMPVDLRELDCDFYTLSCHKMGSPTGVGVLYGKAEWLDRIAPLVGGGEMTTQVSFDACTYAEAPMKFEGGTQSFADIIATGTLIDYLNELDRHKTSKYEQALLRYATKKLEAIDRLVIHGTAKEKEPLISFGLPGLDVKKLEKFLDKEGIAICAGELTAQPLMQHLGVTGLARVSFAFYNTYAEIDQTADAIRAFIKQGS
ncbi:aminotransferase class V-fold PLP-dependent enzyme [Flaviaesturariibacter aridisoli]|uniref:Probable cysteine desulfurase n=1 Tax=Flaviaesturariibacter aridisoli TaxID=2545761 RepID=A0A4R4E4V8_9BACT|nr:cysteine desulfurase [Flaviaesturariibacter aridisoli]TCZ72270.1 cysteine desulfurase [Flaviaesturariibacter aridisoli]